MSSDRNERFVGAHVPDATASGLALASAAIGESRSSLIRQALNEFLVRLAMRKNSSTDRMANRLLGEWNLLQATKGHVNTSRFCKDSRKKMISLGISEESADLVISQLRVIGKF